VSTAHYETTKHTVHLNYVTLANLVKGRRNLTEMNGVKRNLTNEEETELVAFLLDSAF
jgi:hypothetical protein